MKNISFSTKAIIVLVLILTGFVAFRYHKYKEEKNLQAQNELSKFNEIESEIFDLASEENSAEGEGKATDSQLSTLTMEKLKNSGAEFIYQLLLQNQLQIAVLKEDVRRLKDSVTRQNSQERIAKLIFSYVDLRRQIFEKENYDKEFESFVLLAQSHKVLVDQSKKLKENLPNFESAKILQQEFKSLIPSLIATKNYEENGGFFEKIRYSLAKVIVIRKSDIYSKSIDGTVVRVQNYLKLQDYESALIELKALDKKYEEIVKDYVIKLEATNQVYIIDNDILDYLRTMS